MKVGSSGRENMRKNVPLLIKFVISKKYVNWKFEKYELAAWWMLYCYTLPN